MKIKLILLIIFIFNTDLFCKGVNIKNNNEGLNIINNHLVKSKYYIENPDSIKDHLDINADSLMRIINFIKNNKLRFKDNYMIKLELTDSSEFNNIAVIVYNNNINIKFIYQDSLKAIHFSESFDVNAANVEEKLVKISRNLLINKAIDKGYLSKNEIDIFKEGDHHFKSYNIQDLQNLEIFKFNWEKSEYEAIEVNGSNDYDKRYIIFFVDHNYIIKLFYYKINKSYKLDQIDIEINDKSQIKEKFEY